MPVGIYHTRDFLPAAVQIDVHLNDGALLVAPLVFLAGFGSNWVIPKLILQRVFLEIP
jgi:hypothetical protein